VLGGVSDALIAGDWAGAARIAMAGIVLAVQYAKLQVIKAWEDVKLRLLAAWDEVSIAFQTTVAFLASLWQSFLEQAGLKGFADGFVNAIIKGWNAIADAGSATIKFLGRSMQGLTGYVLSMVKAMRTAVNLAMSVDPDFVPRTALETLDSLTPFDTTSAIADALQAGTEAGSNARNNLVGTKMEREADRAGSIDAAAGDLARARAELDAALAAAKAAREKPAAEPGKPGRGPDVVGGGGAAADSLSRASFTTFSATALMAMGGGGNTAKEHLAVAKETKKEIADLRRDFVTLADKGLRE